MKKSLFSMGLMCLALTLTNCQKAQIEEVNPSPEANFELFASPAVTTDAAITRTTNDGLATKWATGDQINIFHAPAGSTTYTNDKAFTLKDAATGSFSGTVGALDGESYDWYAFYPYTSQITTPANTSAGWVVVGGKTPQAQIQNGNNSRTHLSGGACPLFGIAKAVESSAVPSIEMNHLTSIIKVQVTNNSSEDLKVENVSFTGAEDIVGTYYINFAASPVAYKSSGNAYVSSTASLTVSNGEALANGSSADFYIAFKPFTAKTGSTLKLAVNGYEKTLTLKNDITFTAGHIKPLNFNFDKKNYVTIPWVEDFSGALDKYTLVNGGSDTKTYAANLAKGEAPELLVSKNGGSFTAKVKIENNVREFSLTFLSNNHTALDVKSDTEGVNFTKSKDGLYYISVPADIDLFTITFYNSTKDNNYRLDNISLVEGGDPRTNLEAPKNLMAMLNEDDANVTNSIDVVWNAVENAGSYVLTATPTIGDAVVKTVEGGTTNSYTITGLAYETEYTISIYAKPSDTSKYKDSAAVSYEEVVKTGAKPAKVQYSYKISTSDFKGTGYSSSINTITAKSSDGAISFAVSHKNSNAGLQNGKIQFKRSSGMIYNTVDLGEIVSVVLDGVNKDNSYTVYVGSAENPTKTGSGGYFTVKETGGNTLTCTSITVVFEK